MENSSRTVSREMEEKERGRRKCNFHIVEDSSSRNAAASVTTSIRDCKQRNTRFGNYSATSGKTFGL